MSRNLTAFFIDSWAKMPFNIDDQVQQDAFNNDTARLWKLAQTFDSFAFHTIEDVLNELSECKDTLDTDIADLKREVKQLNLDMDDSKVEL